MAMGTAITTLTSIDMTDPDQGIWPADLSGRNYAAHFWHSAEFRGDYWQRQGYWKTLLGSGAFNIR